MNRAEGWTAFVLILVGALVLLAFMGVLVGAWLDHSFAGLLHTLASPLLVSR